MFTRFHRKRFIAAGTPLSDAEFAAALNVRPELLRFVLATREALARVCRVPPSYVHPENTPEAMLNLVTLDWDDMGVIIELEDVLHFPIEEIPTFLGWRTFSIGEPRRQTLGERTIIKQIATFLGLHIFWIGEPAPRTVGEWVLRVAEHLHWSNRTAPEAQLPPLFLRQSPIDRALELIEFALCASSLNRAVPRLNSPRLS